MKGVDPETLRNNLVCLTGDNYAEWSQKFAGLLTFLSRSSHIELDLNAFQDPAWVEAEQDIKNAMASFVEPRFQSLIHGSKTVAVAWDKLKAICQENKTPYELYTLIESFKFTESTSYEKIKQSVQEAEFLCDHLAMQQSAETLAEFHKKARLVSSLPATFASLKQQLIDDLPNLDYETVKSRVLDFGKELVQLQINMPSTPSSLNNVHNSPRTPTKKAKNELRSPAAEQPASSGQQPTDNKSPAADKQPDADKPPAADKPPVTDKLPAAAASTVSSSEKDSEAAPSNVMIVDSKSAASHVPNIADIRYMSQADFEKSLKREASSITPPHRRRSESIEGPTKSRRSESPRRKRDEKRRRSRDGRSRRSRSRERKERRSRNELPGALPEGTLNASINQNKVNRGLNFPDFTDIAMFRNLQNYGSIIDCNKVLLGGFSMSRKEIASN